MKHDCTTGPECFSAPGYFLYFATAMLFDRTWLAALLQGEVGVVVSWERLAVVTCVFAKKTTVRSYSLGIFLFSSFLFPLSTTTPPPFLSGMQCLLRLAHGNKPQVRRTCTFSSSITQKSCMKYQSNNKLRKVPTYHHSQPLL